MKNLILEMIPDKYRSYVCMKKIPSRTILLREGETAKNLYLVEEGCLRIWFNKDGKEITIQFFFENEVVSSIESFFSGKPSRFTIESIEPSIIHIISKKDFKTLLGEVTGLKEYMQDYMQKRLIHYAGLFLSRIKDSPASRYDDLLKNSPHILQRVPQHYIASYLGITPVSLSRIRKKYSEFINKS